MAVYRKSDLNFIQNPPDVDVRSAEFDRWCDEANALCLYDAPLGSEGHVHDEWSEPASKLCLPLITSIYEQGFYEGIEWSGEHLSQVEQELIHLEQYWSQQYQDKPALLNQLHETAQHLRKAIRVAREHDGVVSIT